MSSKSLAQKLVEIQEEIGFLGFDQKNDFHGYQYASAASVIRKLNVALSKRGILATTDTRLTHLLNDGKFAAVQCTIVFTDGESGDTISATEVGGGADKGDKAIMKASTAAYKYAIAHAFTLAWGAVDPEDGNETRSAEEATSGSKPTRSSSRSASKADKPSRRKRTPKPLEDVEGLITDIKSVESADDLPAMMKRIIKFRKDEDVYKNLREVYSDMKESLSE